EAIALYAPEEERLLQDIEKLIKTKIPRGQLALPPRARTARHSDRSRGYHSSAPRKPEDELFYKPYVPSANTKRTERPAPKKPVSNNSSKRSVGVLLGGH